MTAKNMNPRHANGVVDDIYVENERGENGSAMFLQQFQSKEVVKDTSYTNQIVGNREKTSLYYSYFSKQNIEFIQNEIRRLVYVHSNGQYKIGNQSVQELIIIMQSVYDSNSHTEFYDHIEHIRTMNTKVLQYAVPNILRSIEMYNQYRSDKANLPVPLPHAIQTNSKGERTLELGRFL